MVFLKDLVEDNDAYKKTMRLKSYLFTLALLRNFLMFPVCLHWSFPVNFKEFNIFFSEQHLVFAGSKTFIDEKSLYFEWRCSLFELDQKMEIKRNLNISR